MRPTCPDCKQEIDPDVCWCGILTDDHDPFYDGHTPVPMGCICGYIQNDEEQP